MSELLPCPFCGKPAIESWSRDNEVVNIRCSDWRSNVCLGAGPNSYDLDEAIAAWNLRAQPSAEPVAWMHDDPRRVDVIHESVRKLLRDSADSAGQLHRPLDKSERYTIPLYAHPPTDSAALRDAIGLLTIARCPNDGCVDGAIPHGPTHDGDWELEQCQWCYERSAAIAQHGGQSDE